MGMGAIGQSAAPRVDGMQVARVIGPCVAKFVEGWATVSD